MKKTIKLFIVDDSAIVRQTISKLVEDEAEIELLGVAADPIFAMQKFKTTGTPDVLVLDIEMPRMDGITFLKQIMSEQPIATIICSSVAKSGSHKAIEALHAGALELIEKPNVQTKTFLKQSKDSLIHSIKAASNAKLKKITTKKTDSITSSKIESTDSIIIYKKNLAPAGGTKVIAIGSSTGGVQVIENILTSLPAKTMPILITQHMPAGFTASLAKRLDTISDIRVKEAIDGDEVENSTAYIAPGDKHMLIKRIGLKYIINIKDGPKVSHHRPSVDVLFRSFANEVGRSGTGIILTGMGSDGAHGMKEMFDVGAKTYAQDENSCVVYGMPNEAVKLGGVTNSLTIQKIIKLIISVR
ncbi:MAG: chemotaxis response regulator protein-glutamate methylesterase [Campylobacterota bacterium]|nr:chemotaxis response regulator protein-glutamate methylesterase [Campylobacterota bacterium]